MSAAACGCCPPSAVSIHAPFIRLSRETRDLYLRGCDVAVLSSPPSPLTFYRDYVSASLPVLVRSAVDDWPAVDTWRDNAYLRRAMGDQVVSVACTPHGRADSVQDGLLMLPCEERWSFGRFMDYIERPQCGEVCYLQAQNASFSSEYGPLHDDVRPLEWASVAFNDAPDAVNLWMGNCHSLTTLHHDPYENLYAVITGEKTFLLFPPTDLYWLNERTYAVGRYVRSAEGALQAHRDEQASDVPWVVDVEQQLREMEVERRYSEQQERRQDEDEDGSVDASDESSECDSLASETSITDDMRRRYGKSATVHRPRSSNHTPPISNATRHHTVQRCWTLDERARVPHLSAVGDAMCCVAASAQSSYGGRASG